MGQGTVGHRIPEQAGGSLKIQTSLDVKLDKYYLNKNEYSCPLHSPKCKHVVRCPWVSDQRPINMVTICRPRFECNFGKLIEIGDGDLIYVA